MDVISFFTGGGFLDLGFEQAGFNVCWTNEYDDDIADLYEHGMTTHRFATQSITAPMVRISSRESIGEVSPCQIEAEAGVRGKEFGVIGGPPCPDFSIGGKQAGGEGERGKLTSMYAHYVIGLKPAFFVMENVPGLYTTAKHRQFLFSIIKRYEDAGYITDFKILNALNYGVPQDRNRLFIVGFRKDALRALPPGSPIEGKGLHGWFQWPDEPYPMAKDKYPWPGKKPFGIDPVGGIPDIPHCLMVLNPLRYATYHMNSDEFFKPKSDKFGQIDEGDVERKSCKRLHRYRYSPTACYGNNEVHFHPWLPRRLSVREALRIQTVPDTYVLPADATLSKKFKMIGNGVPVRLAAHLGGAIIANYEKWKR